MPEKQGREARAREQERAQMQEYWPPVSPRERQAAQAQVRKTSGQLAPILASHLALVWCLKPQLSTAAVAAGAVETVGTAVVVVTPTCSFQDGFAVAEEAEAEAEAATAAAAAPESGCCSAAVVGLV